MNTPVDAIPDDENRVAITNTIWTHALPFITWIVCMSLLPSTGWAYAVRTVLGLGLFVWCCPWRWYPRLNGRHLPGAVLIGIVVAVLWIMPESHWLKVHSPLFYEGYQYLGIVPPWSLPAARTATPYAPEVCGWIFTLIRLMGSAIAVGCIEEFFWRGFVYRWLIRNNFLKVSMGSYHPLWFWITALLFSLEHDRWLVGLLAGAIYGWYAIRTRDIWAVSAAHAITNLVLGIYVITTQSWFFW